MAAHAAKGVRNRRIPASLRSATGWCCSGRSRACSGSMNWTGLTVPAAWVWPSAVDARRATCLRGSRSVAGVLLRGWRRGVEVVMRFLPAPVLDPVRRVGAGDG
ncbi:hypothetical protein DFQ14_107206 [Halopolyspora algeriensis]|uniref:Uncharacterized protein n=1 Tax=Halopolyspora algeriensis TaxID=1500506 RepID=A0A368VTK5_9ACTN|nr:hypothetical protein DFQ14_107206 [Halopolyspora algeriensis]TQM56374.1 hypothetical protein FHU43_1169 [Halopolyspora algeriensis]